jgi:6-pyruvoyl-tetrahydropterin synthase
MTSTFVSMRFEIPMQHRLNIDYHSPRRHGHNLFVTIKIKSKQDNLYTSKSDLNHWATDFKNSLATKDLEQILPQPTTEQVMQYVVNHLQSQLSHLDVHEVHIQETSKNQFVWTNLKSQ